MRFPNASDFVPAKFSKNIQNAPREVLFNRQLMLSAIIYATAAIPASMLLNIPTGSLEMSLTMVFY